MDDDALVTRSLARILTAARPDLEISTASSAHDALLQLAASEFDAVITDLDMPNLAGLAWLATLRREHPQLLCVTHSSQLESFGEDEVRRLSHATFEKPAHAHALLAELTRLIGLRTAQTDLRSA